MAFDTLVDKTQLENSITATADAIRAKTSKTDKIVWDMNNGFASAISDLTSEQINPPGIIPASLKAAAMEVARKVNEARKSDSIVFMAMSDSHHTGEQSDTGWQTLTNLGNLHAGMAAKVLSYALDLDFVCHLGDNTFGHGTTTSELLHQQVEEMNQWLDEAWTGIPRFQTVGNHDTGMYGHDNSGFPMETNEYLFSVFGKYCEGAVYGSETYGYCYRDFTDKKVRVICLNTSEGDSLKASYECSPAQLLWFAQTLKSVGANDGWSVIVLGHYPLDFYGMHDATAVVKAYVDGSSITLNGTTVNFSGSNKAKFIANFHGHTHCFKVARLNALDVNTKTATEYNAMRVGIPNSGYYRNNHQEGPNAYGLYFEEETTYDKTNDGVHDTAFVVNVITPSEEVIHSFCYGAGYDRSIGYGNVVYHTVTKTASNATITSVSSVEDGKSFTATITPDEHCAITSAVITMGGTDITSSVYSNGVINIPSVTGDVVITVKAAIALACVNQIPISTDANGAIYNGKGYKERTYCNNGNESTNNSNDLTGFIPCRIGDIIRLKNMPFGPAVSTSRLSFFKSDKSYIGQALSTSSYYLDTVFKGVKDADGNYIEFTIKEETNMTIDCAFVRISAADINDSSIVTINEEIIYVDELDGQYAITYSLANATSSNKATTVVGGSGYTSTITINDGYEFSKATVTMGGVDITASAYANGVITIPYVTGNVAITITAIKIATYTNQLLISTGTDGAIYNGKGYKENTYLSSGNESSRTGSYTTGFIPCTTNDVVRMKNVTFDNDASDSGYHRIMFYDKDKNYLTGGNSKSTAAFAKYTLDDNGVYTMFQVRTSFSSTDLTGMKFFRLCCPYIGTDSVITINEEIE